MANEIMAMTCSDFDIFEATALGVKLLES